MIIADLDSTPHTVTPQSFYYYMGHFSRHLVPGSVRIDAKLPDPLQGTAAVTPSGDLVLVAQNDGDSEVKAQVAWNDAFLPITVPAHGIVTVTWPSA